MISDKDKETLIRLKDAAEKLRNTHIRVELCDYPSTQMANHMMKMAMYLYCSIYNQLSEEFRNEYDPYRCHLRELATYLKTNLEMNYFRLDGIEERTLANVIEVFEEQRIIN